MILSFPLILLSFFSEYKSDRASSKICISHLGIFYKKFIHVCIIYRLHLASFTENSCKGILRTYFFNIESAGTEILSLCNISSPSLVQE